MKISVYKDGFCIGSTTDGGNVIAMMNNHLVDKINGQHAIQLASHIEMSSVLSFNLEGKIFITMVEGVGDKPKGKMGTIPKGPVLTFVTVTVYLLGLYVIIDAII